jgi:hypothetical protein
MLTVLTVAGEDGRVGESTQASKTEGADKVRLCLFIVRKNG